MLLRALSILLLAAAACSLAAQDARADDVVRYVDDEGVVHLSVSGARGPAAGAPRAQPGGSKGGAPGRSLAARRTRLDPLIAEAARYYQIPTALVLGVIRVESAFHTRAVSRVGAIGLMQLMPRTARAMHVRDPFDPRDNVFGGCRYLRLLLNRFDGDLVLTLAAYNAGEGAVMRKQGVPYAQTEGYVRSVLRHYDRYRRQERHP